MIKIIKAHRGPIGKALALTLVAMGAAGGVALADNALVKAKAPYAQASAQINADGTRAQSKGIKSSTRVATGVYCITFDDATKIDVSRSTPVATIVTTGSEAYAINLRTTPSPECVNSPDAVTVYTGISGALLDTPFMLLVP